MRILFAGNKNRGVLCLKALRERGHEVVAVLAHAGPDAPTGSVAGEARSRGLRLLQPPDPNDPQVLRQLRELRPELTVLAGYSPIVKREFIQLSSRGCLNLHAGKLPEFRGSSPLNWALLRGESRYTLSVIQVSEGVDAGDVLCERTFPISSEDTIADLQAVAEREFPGMLLETVEAVEKGTVRRRVQDPSAARYFPLRFPEDGLILWDQLEAREIHDRIRALTSPYPGAFSYWKGRKVFLLRSSMTRRPFFGEPGRVYRRRDGKLLVGARDRCLWILQSKLAETGEDAAGSIARYDCFSTVRGWILEQAGKA